jgi:hypothetical protein
MAAIRERIDEASGQQRRLTSGSWSLNAEPGPGTSWCPNPDFAKWP